MTRLRLTLTLVFTLLTAYCVTTTMADPNGVTGRSKVGCGGGGCHAAAKSSATTITFWADSATFYVNQPYVFHLTVTNASTSTKAAGCDISVDNGAALSKSSAETYLKLSNSELTHAVRKSKVGDSVTWTFIYTPKKAGTAHLYAAGNAVNANGAHDNGDIWNLGSLTLTVLPALGPAILVPPTVSDTALVDSQTTASVWIKNIGTGPLTIKSYSLSGTIANWSITDSSSHSIGAVDSAVVKVMFTPTAIGSSTVALRINSNDATTPTTFVSLVGLGTAAKLLLDSTYLSGGTVTVGGKKIFRGLIRNTGNIALNISSIAVQSANGTFSLANKRAFPISIKSNASFADTFQYVPASVGFDTAYATISYVETSTPKQQTIMLIGQGLQDLAVDTRQEASPLSIAPNPSTGLLRVHSSLEETAEITMTDEAGRIVALFHDIRLNDATLDARSLPNGSYVLKLQTKGLTPAIRHIVIAH